jgi:hypothetical protein
VLQDARADAREQFRRQCCPPQRAHRYADRGLSISMTTAQGFRKETELLFGSVIREDCNVSDLLTADARS